jgi:hypothetical protein
VDNSGLKRLAWGVSLGGHRGVASMEADVSYYRRRAAEETRGAAASTDPHVQRIHLELARLYDQRLSKLEADERRAQLRIVDAA